MWFHDFVYRSKYYILSLLNIYTILIFSTIILLAIFKLYLWITTRVYRGTISMNGKTVIITGCNSGIGKETAKDLAYRGARVIMACRNMKTGTIARDEIINESKNSNVILMMLDLSSLSSVRQFADKVNQQETRLDVLINNAGVSNLFKKYVTEDGLELTMATNQYGPFLLTNLLLPLLEKTKSSRIVIVSSIMYRLARVSLNNPNPINGIPIILYCVSKYANILFTVELARRLKESNSDVTCNCLHPGVIRTNIFRNIPFPLNLPLKLISKLFFKTVMQGAQTSIYLSVSEDVINTSGTYFEECKEVSLRKDVLNEVTGKRYWDICEKLVKLQPN